MNPLNPIINPANDEDLPSLLEVVRGCISVMERQGIHQWDDIYPNENILRNDIKTKTLWIARVDDRAGGMVVLNEYQNPEYQQVQWRCEGRILVVHRLMVAAEYQNQKLATHLMQFTEGYARDKKYDAIRLDAFIQNPYAIKLYRRLQYIQAGTVTFRKGEFYCFEKKINWHET
jgi:ribosomal protein S18 acetylase RimI-like enzyme